MLNNRRLILAHFWFAFATFGVALLLGAWQMYVRSPLHPWLSQPELYYRSVTAHGSVMAYVFPTLIAMGFRFWALRAEEAHLSDEPERRTTLRDVFLLRRLTGLRAHLARLIYWLCLFLAVFVVTAAVIGGYDDPRTVPSNLVVLVAWVGWAIGLRYWAQSHSERAAA